MAKDDIDITPSSTSTFTSLLLPALLVLLPFIIYFISGSYQSSDQSNMSTKANKQRETQYITTFREITGASQADATKFVKKYKGLEQAVEAFFSDSQAQASASSKGDKAKEKKLGEIWERFKDSSNPKLITIEGTMQYCEELGIDPESDSVLFCLATDLGSKATGEWEREPFVQGWASMPGNVDSLAGMKNALPGLRKRLNTDPVYFKQVYMHTFDLAKPEGARTLPIDTALGLWNVYIPPALESRPSALSRIPSGDPPNSPSTDRPPEFTHAHFEKWIEFQKKKGKAVSKDTWSLFVDFIRSIDADFKEYDDSAAWPSTIDDFVDHVRAQK